MIGNQISFSFWTKLNSYDQSDARFISKAYGQFDDEHFWMLSALNDTWLRFRLKTNGTTHTLITCLNAALLNEWFFVTVTYDGNFLRLYMNAKLLDSLAVTGYLSTDPFANAVLGNQPAAATGGVRPLDGYIDEMRIYASSLSNEQIQQIYQARFTELCLSDLVIQGILPNLNFYIKRNILS